MNLKVDLSFLTPEQQAAFAAVNALVGLGADECTYAFAEQSLSTQPHNMVLSSDPAESDVPPLIIPIGSIAEYRKVAGFDDIHPKAAVREEDESQYPAPLTDEEKQLLNGQPTAMKPSVSPELRDKIRKAATAYVMLDRERVREYEALINATMFPGKVAVFVAPDLNVPANEVVTLTGPDGTVFNYGTVTVGTGGSIAVDVNCTFNCQTFTQL